MEIPGLFRQKDVAGHAIITVKQTALRCFYQNRIRVLKTKEGQMNMEIQVKNADRNLLLAFQGELDHHGARNALREVEMAIDAALPKTLVMDFAGVSFMDSSGIALILRAQQRMQLLEGSILVCNVPPQARRVLDAAGIGRLVTIR